MSASHAIVSALLFVSAILILVVVSLRTAFKAFERERREQEKKEGSRKP